MYIIGTDEETVRQSMKEFETEQYAKMSKACNLFGDGKALERIIGLLKEEFN